jgi:hypothetical protein
MTRINGAQRPVNRPAPDERESMYGRLLIQLGIKRLSTGFGL